jgi:hypothetical protein
MSRLLRTGALVAAALVSATAVAAPVWEEHLYAGRLPDAEQTLTAQLAESPDDDTARFALGIVQTLRAVERASQSLHRLGWYAPASADVLQLFGRGPVKLPVVTPASEPPAVTYADIRALMQRLVTDLAAADETLARVSDPAVAVRLCPGRIHLDLNGDGVASDAESIWAIATLALSDREAAPRALQTAAVRFDRADVEWFRGYGRLVRGLGEALLAHDFREFFERTGHLLFARPVTPHDYLVGKGQPTSLEAAIVDIVTILHLMRFPVCEPQRMTVALEHFEAMLAHSRRMWELIDAETDDDAEWLPGPHQTGVFPGLRITRPMVDAWRGFLEEAEALLAGRKLVPFWRDAGGRGVNLRRVFTEPREFDFILWVQGTAATPFLEEGRATSPDVWRRLGDVFEGRFLTYITWIR